jgi:urease accessory protein
MASSPPATSHALRPTVAGGPELERASGRLELAWRQVGTFPGTTRLHRGYQEGSLRVRFPRSPGPPEAVLLNTAGGMTGGDRFRVACALGQGAEALVTSQAAERVYRALDGTARVEVELDLGPGSRLRWLPQETILFDGGRLSRRIRIRMAEDARLLLCESVVLGRTAHGETVRRGSLLDRWELRRGDRLVWADALRLEGDIPGQTWGRATLGGGRGFATLLLAAPDAARHLEEVRAQLTPGKAPLGPPVGPAMGVSAWEGLLAVRMVADEGRALRRGLLRALSALRVPTPRLWSL